MEELQEKTISDLQELYKDLKAEIAETLVRKFDDRVQKITPLLLRQVKATIVSELRKAHEAGRYKHTAKPYVKTTEDPDILLWGIEWEDKEGE